MITFNDCCFSLHRGEGWNYPLFEAGSRGKSIASTGFSGPVEYLDPSVHHLVRLDAGCAKGMAWEFFIFSPP